MAKLQDSYEFIADFRFRTCKDESRTVVYVDEYITTYHVSVKHLGWALPEIIDLIIKKKSAKNLPVFTNIRAEIQKYIDNRNL